MVSGQETFGLRKEKKWLTDEKVLPYLQLHLHPSNEPFSLEKAIVSPKNSIENPWKPQEKDPTHRVLWTSGMYGSEWHFLMKRKRGKEEHVGFGRVEYVELAQEKIALPSFFLSKWHEIQVLGSLARKGKLTKKQRAKFLRKYDAHVKESRAKGKLYLVTPTKDALIYELTTDEIYQKLIEKYHRKEQGFEKYLDFEELAKHYDAIHYNGKLSPKKYPAVRGWGDWDNVLWLNKRAIEKIEDFNELFDRGDFDVLF